MKKLFLILMMCLLPYQFAWAMVASYDTHGAHDTDVHFGHHEHVALSNDANQSADTSQSTDSNSTQNHLHLGFLHLSCGELIDHALPVFEQQTIHFVTPYTFSYYSPPSAQPERPNWASLV
jgi:hypothetical protein